MNKIKLIEDLKKHHHNFLNKNGCESFLKPFDIPVKVDKVKANPQDFKGLSLWDKDGKSMKEGEGLSGVDISGLIVSKLKLSVRDFFGRGFQHQANCETIIKHLEKVKK